MIKIVIVFKFQMIIYTSHSYHENHLKIILIYALLFFYLTVKSNLY